MTAKVTATNENLKTITKTFKKLIKNASKESDGLSVSIS